MTDLVVYENHDVYLEHPTRAHVPQEIDTLDNFLGIVSAHIAASSGDATAAGRYRFVYSLMGKPLWRVADCREATELIVSCTPGFLLRKQNTDKRGPSEKVYHRPVKFSRSTPLSDSFSSITNASISSVTLAANTTHSAEFLPPHGAVGPSRRKSPEREVVANDDGDSCGDRSTATLKSAAWMVNGRRVMVPPIPCFFEPLFSAETEAKHREKVSAVDILIALKLLGRPFLENEILYREELRSRLEPVIAAATSTTGRDNNNNSTAAVRVVVEGPPKSGVSTALAYCCHMTVSVPKSRLYNSFFLPLNFDLLFDGAWLQSGYGEETGVKGTCTEPNRKQGFLLDIPFFFLTLLRHVVDCAVVQRPTLSDAGKALVEAWEKLMMQKDTAAVPHFRDLWLAQVMGHRVLHELDVFAVATIQVLRAARDSSNDMILRDVVIEVVLVRFVALMASVFQFSSVVYIIDSLQCLVDVLWDRVKRPLGDVGVFLRCLSHHPWAHVIAGVNTLAFPPPSVLFSMPVQSVQLLHLLSPDVLVKRYGYPLVIYCGGKQFPLQIFMGSPGYLRVLHALLESHAWMAMERGKGENYALRVDDDNVFCALESLRMVVRPET